ncbi:MAG: hypothetical protein M3Z98_01430 [Candidatus Dormibacteraeota bacterium]|nr:hypothetical protein [Candidatus Dormibacteraeota bacterium]
MEDVPVRADPGALKPPTPAIQPAQVRVPADARSGWVSQLYPASAALNANRKLVTYAGLGILGLIALYVLYQVLVNAGLFNGGGGNTLPDTGPTGTQFQQADGFLTKSLNPALASVASAEKPIAVDCGGSHSVTCRNTLENADSALVLAIRAIDQGTFPGCLSTTVVLTRRDLAVQEQVMRAALIGFRSNTDDLVTRGLADYTAASATVAADGNALKAAAQTACPKSP